MSPTGVFNVYAVQPLFVSQELIVLSEWSSCINDSYILDAHDLTLKTRQIFVYISCYTWWVLKVDIVLRLKLV